MPREYVKEYTREELIAVLRRVASRNHGRPLSWRQYDALKDPSDPSGNTFRSPHYFGTWREALEAADLPLTPPFRAKGDRAR